MKKSALWPIMIAAVSVFAAGCGQSQAIGQKAPAAPKSKAATPKKTAPRVLRIGAGQYEGSKNLSKFKKQAASNPQSYAAQIEAGTAAEVNNDAAQAIAYWQKAIKLNPKAGNPYEYIGNIYLNDDNNPSEAMVWYKKSITYGPSYVMGWYRVVELEAHAGNMAAAKKYAAEAAKLFPASNKALIDLEGFANPKKTSTSSSASPSK
jgi:tetratricopeptide (TPR) repeat protein